MATVLKYNPGILGDSDLIRSFVVRQRCYELILESLLERSSDAVAPQHLLVFGPRGIGKTTLVRRIAAEIRRDPILASKWLPVVFGEESYQITSAGEFWLEALIHVSRLNPSPEWDRTLNELREEHKDAVLRERALAQLRDIADRNSKRILLVVENLDMVCEQISYEAQWELRHAFANERQVTLLGTAVSRFNAISSSDQAWFDLFAVQELKPLNNGECQSLWESIAHKSLRPAQSRAIRILTGGNPRLVTVLASFASSRSFRELMEQLVHLIDEHTEYFKSHLDSLPVKERKVFVGLLEYWKPVAAADLANAVRMTVNEVSAQLNRLVGRGAVEVVDQRPRRKLYQAAERLYNIYYLMRRRGEPADRVRAAVTFMVTFYAGRELAASMAELAREACSLGAEETLDHFVAYAELARRAPTQVWERALHQTPDEFFSREDAPESVRNLRTRTKSNDLAIVNSYIKKRDWVRAEEAARAGIVANEHDARLWAALAFVLLSREAVNESERAFRRVTELQPSASYGWYGLGQVLMITKRERDAQEVFQRAVELDPKNSLAWRSYGEALGATDRDEAAVQAYRKATRFAPDDSRAWRGLGESLQTLGNNEEAESALRRAVLINPSDNFAWQLLARMLHLSGSNKEAEEAFRKAIAIDPGYYSHWTDLGHFLSCIGKNREAEQVLRKAIEINPKFPCSWHYLGSVLTSSGQVVEAEQACRKAIELDRKHTSAWTALGIALAKAKRHSEAEDAFHTVLQFEPSSASAWANLGRSLKAQLRYEEAKNAFNKAIELEPNTPSFLSDLAHLVSELGSPAEAERVWTEALRLHPSLAPCSVHLLEARFAQGSPEEGLVKEAEAWLDRGGRTSRMLMSMARLVLRLELTSSFAQAELWCREAIEKDPGWKTAETLALVLGAQRNWSGAVQSLPPLIEAARRSKRARSIVTDLVIHAAAHGYARECLAVLKAACSSTLEPLLVGLQLHLDDAPLVPKEILEIGSDVASQIRALQNGS